MSDSYTVAKTAMDKVIKDSPSTKIRGSVHNLYTTKALQLSRDRIGNVTFDQTDIEDEALIYYNSSTSAYECRKIEWITAADMAAYNLLAFDTDYHAMDYIEITDNGYGQTELRRYIDGAIRTISKYQTVEAG